MKLIRNKMLTAYADAASRQEEGRGVNELSALLSKRLGNH